MSDNTESGDTHYQAELRQHAIETWDEIFEGPDGTAVFLDMIVKQLGKVASVHAVDVGCGTGHIASQLVARTDLDIASLVGVDASAPMLELAAHASSDPRLAWTQADFRQLPMADESVDLVISRLADYDPAEVARVLRHGGVFAEYGLGPCDSAEIAEAFGERYTCEYAPRDQQAWLARRSAALDEHGLRTRALVRIEAPELLDDQQLVETIEMVPLVEPFSPEADATVLASLARELWGGRSYVRVHRDITLRIAKRDTP